MRWSKEWALIGLATTIALTELINAEVLGRGNFHYEFLGFSAGLIGLALTGKWGDKR